MVGLFVLPLAILMQIGNTLTLKESLAFSGFGVTAFLLGYMLQGVSASKSGKGGKRP